MRQTRIAGGCSLITAYEIGLVCGDEERTLERSLDKGSFEIEVEPAERNSCKQDGFWIVPVGFVTIRMRLVCDRRG